MLVVLRARRQVGRLVSRYRSSGSRALLLISGRPGLYWAAHAVARAACAPARPGTAWQAQRGSSCTRRERGKQGVRYDAQCSRCQARPAALQHRLPWFLDSLSAEQLWSVDSMIQSSTISLLGRGPATWRHGNAAGHTAAGAFAGPVRTGRYLTGKARACGAGPPRSARQCFGPVPTRQPKGGAVWQGGKGSPSKGQGRPHRPA